LGERLAGHQLHHTFIEAIYYELNEISHLSYYRLLEEDKGTTFSQEFDIKPSSHTCGEISLAAPIRAWTPNDLVFMITRVVLLPSHDMPS
jgi:hypothetical protein